MTDTTIDLQAVQRGGAWLGAAHVRPVLRSWMEALAHILRPVSTSDEPLGKAEREAAAVREMALRYRETDRGFAADLFAAADRHEELARAARPGAAADRR